MSMFFLLAFVFHFARIFADVCSPQEAAKTISKEGCPDLFDTYKCGDKIEHATYSTNGEKCTGVWHSNWEFEIVNNEMYFHDIKKSTPARIDGVDVIFDTKYELRRWLEYKPIRELEEALARMESGDLIVKPWHEEEELTVEEEVGVMHAVADAFEFHGYEEHAVGLRKQATSQSVSRRRNLGISKVLKNGIDFCEKTKSCEAAFQVGLDHVLGLSSSLAQDFCKKHHDKMDYEVLNCCNGKQCLFYCMSNPSDSCADLFAPKEPIHCCGDYDYNSQSMRCYKEKEVCPPGMTSCSLASVFAPAAYCSRGAGACWEKLGEMVIRVADVALSIGSMIFSGGASAAAKAAIKAGATALKTVTKAAARTAMKTAIKTAFKQISKSLKRGMIDHFKTATQEIIFTYMVEEASMTITAQRAQAEGSISADDVLGMVDPTGVYELIGFFNSFEDCHYVPVPTHEELMDLRLESLKQTQDLRPDQIAPYYGTWKGRYLSWPSYKHVEMHFGCDGSLSFTGVESQMVIFDTSYAQDICGDGKYPWSFVVHGLWGTEYLDCGYMNGLIFMQRFRVPEGDDRAQEVDGYAFVATPTSRERTQMPCGGRRTLQSLQDFTHSGKNSATCPADGTIITTENECKQAAGAYGKTYKRKSSWWNHPKGCFQNHKGWFYFNTHPTGRKKSDANVVCLKKRDTNQFFVDFDYEYSIFNTVGCDEYLAKSQCQELATVERYHSFETVTIFELPKGCFTTDYGRVFFNTINTDGQPGIHVVQICKKTIKGDYQLPSGALAAVHAGGTNECTEQLFPAKCTEFATMIGDTNGIDDYYRPDWPQGCLIDFHSEIPRVYWNYVPDGTRGESDMDVAPVCRVCPSNSGCGYTPQKSYENRNSHFYVYRANVVSTLTKTLSRNLVEDFCDQQGLVLATPRNGYEINEILNQASNLIISPVEREDSGKGEIAYQSSGVQGETSWGEFYSIEGDQTPKIAIGLRCSKDDDCSKVSNWHWSDDKSSYYGDNFEAANKGTLAKWLYLKALTADQQNKNWEKEQRAQSGCGYYDYDFYHNKHHEYESTYFREEVIRCRHAYWKFDGAAGGKKWDEFRAIESARTAIHDQCAYIDWDVDSTSRSTISYGACDREEYVLFACSSHSPSNQVKKEDRSCQGRYFDTDNCQNIQNRERCLESTEDQSKSAKNCVWCSHGPCLANGHIRCATEQFLSQQSDSLSSHPEQIGITADKNEIVDSTSQYEQCKVVAAVANPEDLFTIVEGCQVRGPCISSSNFPSNYNSNDKCTVKFVANVETVVEDVLIEQSWDRLWIGEKDVRDIDDVPASILAGTELKWTSDGDVNRKGWKICFEAGDSTVPSLPTYAFGQKGKGAQGCPAGYEAIYDGAECRDALNSLSVRIQSVSNSRKKPCYKDNRQRGYNNGHHGGGASFICRAAGNNAEAKSEEALFSMTVMTDTNLGFLKFAFRLISVVGVFAVCLSFCRNLTKETSYNTVEEQEI